MKVEKIPVGMLQENCYLIKKEDSCLIVDPGDEFEKIKNKIGDFKVCAILITHHHFDHVGALEECKKVYQVPVIDFKLGEREFKIGSFTFKTISTPGHTKDSITYYFESEKIMLTGDFLFHEDVGRVDLEGGSLKEMIESLKKIKSYPDDITIYPGHEESSTLGLEKKENHYLSRI